MIDRNFTQRTRLRMIGAVILFVGLVVGLTACIGLWQAPEAVLRITSPSPMGMFEAPLTVIFDISESFGRGQEIVTFKLDFGDGTYIEGTDITLPIEHTYREAGLFFAELTITDAAGATGRDEIRIDTLPVHVYFSTFEADFYFFRVSRVPAAGGKVEIVGGAPLMSINFFPSLVLNTRDKIAFASVSIMPGFGNGNGPVPELEWNIWTMGTEGQLPTQLTHTTDSEFQPTWSHDGDTIAYTRRRAGLWEIWTMTAAGANESVLITQTPSLIHVWAPAFSPINDDLVFVRQDDAGGTSELWIRRGTAEPVVLYSVANVRVGDPSPAITFLDAPADAITLMLGLPTGAGISQPRWSPCGEKIVFARERAAGGIIDIHILTVPATGAATASETLEAYVRGLVDPDPVPLPEITTDDHEFSPHWLEDGNIVFFREVTPGEFRLFHVNLATGALTELTDPGVALSPAQR